MKLSPEQKEWLTQHGDRNESHVLLDGEGRYFIEFYHPHMPLKVEKVYLPYQKKEPQE